MLTAGNSALRAGRGILFFIDRACEREGGKEGEEETVNDMRCKLVGWWVSPSVGVCVQGWPGQRWRLAQLGLHCPSESPPGMPHAAVTQREGEERRISH